MASDSESDSEAAAYRLWPGPGHVAEPPGSPRRIRNNHLVSSYVTTVTIIMM